MGDLRAAAAAVALAAATGAAAAPPAVQEGVYTAAQAARGEVLYSAQCASCHGPLRAIIPEVAALLGDHTFRNTWRGRRLGELFAFIRETMPQDAPGTLTPPQTADLVAYILSGNRLAAGETPLADAPERLSHVLFEAR